VALASRVTGWATGATVETDGQWCPMAHANREDNSVQLSPPLREVASVTHLCDPRLARGTLHNLGAFTGSDYALCVYASTWAPTLVAFDLHSGEILWTSETSHLKMPGHPFRSGALLACVKSGTERRRFVYAGCATEFAAYNATGGCLWRRAVPDRSATSPYGFGAPIALTYTDSGAIAAATSEGWVVTLDPLSGRLLETARMRGQARIAGCWLRGVFASSKSPAVIDDRMYLSTEFKADRAVGVARSMIPTHLVRVDLRGERIRVPGTGGDRLGADRWVHRVGFLGARGSPCAVRLPGGETLVFTNAQAAAPGDRRPIIAAVADDDDRLSRRWETNLELGERIFAAPAYHPITGMLFVSTTRGVYVFRQADAMWGSVPPPRPLCVGDLIGPRFGAAVANARFASPFALSYDEERDEVVAYTGVRIGLRQTYGFLAAFTLSTRGALRARPLWVRPLATTVSGRPAPGPGTLGQPALFRYRDDDGERTGIIVVTAQDGTVVLR
jgi:hypothetical protein